MKPLRWFNLAIVILLGAVAKAPAPIVRFNLLDLTGSTAQRDIVLMPTNAPGFAAGQSIVVSAPKVLRPVNGYVETNLIGGVYRMTFTGITGFSLLCVPNDGGPYWATDLACSNLPLYAVGPLPWGVEAGTNIDVTTNIAGGKASYVVHVERAPDINLQNATNLPVAAIAAGGTRDASTYLRGDGQWATPPGGNVATENSQNIIVNTNGSLYSLNIGPAVATTNRAQTFYGSQRIEGNVISSSGSFIGNGSGITNIPIAGIAAIGIPSDSTFLRGDGRWAEAGAKDFVATSDSSLITVSTNGNVFYVSAGDALARTNRSQTFYADQTVIGFLRAYRYEFPSNTVVIGYNAASGGPATAGASPTFNLSTIVGGVAAYVTDGWTNSTLVGYNAGGGGGSGNFSEAIGYSAGRVATNTYRSTFVGAFAGERAINIRDSVGFGYGALQSATNSAQLVGVGMGAAYKPFGSYNSVSIGYYAGGDAYTNANNVFVGSQAGRYTWQATNNAALGADAMYFGFRAVGNTNQTIGPSGSVAIGYRSLYWPWISNTIAIGNSSGFYGSNIVSSVLIGPYFTGANLTNATNVYIIGPIQRTQTNTSDILAIDSQNTYYPLIWGEFGTRLLRVHGWLDVTNKIRALEFHGNALGLSNLPVTGIAASGVPNSTTFLRGDGQWVVPAGGGSASYVDSENDLHIVVTTNGNTYTLDVGEAIARTNRPQRFYGDQQIRGTLTVEGALTLTDAFAYSPIWTLSGYNWDWQSTDSDAYWNMQNVTGLYWWVPSGQGATVYGNFRVNGTLAGTNIVGNGYGLTNIPVTSLATSGSANATNVLYGNGQWAAIPTDSYFIVVPRATGNATTDWNNLQAALDQTTNAPSYYGARAVVLIPPGSYVINQRLLLRAHGLTVAGSGVERTRIYQQSSTEPVFDIHGIGGWTWGGSNQLWWAKIENLGLSKTRQTVGSSTSAAIEFTSGVTGSQQASRLILHRLKIENFYIGVYIGHGVGLDASHLELYGNNFGAWLAHSDNSRFEHVYLGDAEDGNGNNQFGTNTSAGIVYTTWEGTAGRSLILEAFEGRGVHSILRATNGLVSIRHGNIELMRTGPIFVFSSPWGVAIESIRATRVSGVEHPWVDYIGNPLALSMRNFMFLDDLSSAPRIRFWSSSVDFPFYWGQPLLVSNATLQVARTLPMIWNARDGVNANIQIYSPLYVGNAASLTNLPVSAIAASGTPDATTFLRGDGVWAVPSGGGAQSPVMEWLGIWAQAPNSGTTPAASPSGAFSVDAPTGVTAANSMTDMNNNRDIPAISFTHAALDVTSKVRYGGNLSSAVTKYGRVYHIVSVDNPADMNVWVGIANNPGGQTDWPIGSAMVFCATNGFWQAMVRVDTGQTHYIKEINEPVQAGKRYVLAFIRQPNGDVGAYINGQLRATFAAAELPSSASDITPAVWVKSKTSNTLIWRWYKTHFDYAIEN